MSGREDLAKKATKRGEKPGAVEVFRGVSFDDWLRVFMQVSVHPFYHCSQFLIFLLCYG